MKKISINDLVVARFDSKVLTPALAAHKLGRKIFRPESCSKQLWVGSRDDFMGVTLDPRVMHYGATGYSFLLSFIDGALSKKKFENHAKSQFFSYWDKHKAENILTQDRFSDVIKMLKKDSTFIRDKYTNHYKIPRYEVVARDLARQKNGARVLIISESDKFDSIHKYTANLIKASDNIQKSNIPYVTITHPNDLTLRRMAENFNKNAHDFSRRPVAFENFTHLQSLINQSDVVYNGLVMNNAPEDRRVMQAWGNRINKDTQLAHIRGMHEKRSQSSPMWALNSLNNIISPERIQSAYEQRLGDNKVLKDKLNQVYQACAGLRLQGRSPSYEINRGAYDIAAPVFRL